MDDKQKIKELEMIIHNLEKDLIHDSLTTLKTRAFFEEECNTYLSAIANLEAGKRKEWFGFTHLSVLFIDIDHFKKINDTYGHDMGDKVLRNVGETVNKSLREGDTVARWGGEEIVAFLLGANENDAKEKAEIIRKKVESLSFSEPDLKVTISVGVSGNFKGANCAQLLKNADLALYKAKNSGRNKVITFSEIKE